MTDREQMESEEHRPERNPFACSRCGCYLGPMKRLGDTDDYCDGCISEVLGPYAL